MAAVPASSLPHRRWWRWGLGALAGLLLAAGLVIWLGFDPWLRRTLERQVQQQTHGQYHLAIASLQTRLYPAALHLRGIELRPATAHLADTLPNLTLRLVRLDAYGVGLLAWLRGRTIPIDSLVLDSGQVQVAALARRPPPHPAPPLYQQRPLRLGYLAVRRVGGCLGAAEAPTLRLARADVQARDLLFTPAGVADTIRLAGAASWQAAVRYSQGRLGGHVIQLARAAFSSGEQTFSLDSLSIEPPAPGRGRPGATQVALLLPHLRVRGLQAATWQHRHRFRADSLVGQQPRLSFKPPAQPPPPLWKLLQPLARRADVGCLQITDGLLAIPSLRHQPVARHFYATGQALRVDSVSGQPGRGRILYARAWVARSGLLTTTLDPPVYPTRAGHLALDTWAGTLRLTELVLEPRLSPAQLNRRSGYQVMQLSGRLPELRFSGVDFNLLSDRSQLHIARVVAEHPWLKLASDGRGPINPHRSPLTPEALRDLTLPLSIDRFEVRGGTIHATYRSPLTPRTGYFTVSQLTGTARHLSNQPGRWRRAPPLTIEATALLGGRSRLQAHLVAPGLGRSGQHHLWGTIGAAPLSILNPITVPTRLLGFKSGRVQRIGFDMQVSRRQVTGTMQASYRDLKFELFSYKDSEIKRPLWARLKTGAVNLVVRDNNPRPGGRFVTGDMTSRRELRFSVVSAWRQGLVSGLLNSAGVPGKLAQKLSASQTVAPLPK